MTVQETINRICDAMCGGFHIKPTCDVLAAGSYDTEVTGIVTTFIPSIEVIRKTIELGANFIISHEPTWFNGVDKTDWCENDSVYLAKKSCWTSMASPSGASTTTCTSAPMWIISTRAFWTSWTGISISSRMRWLPGSMRFRKRP